MPSSIGHLHLNTLIAKNDPPIRVMEGNHTTIGRHDHDFYELVYVRDGYCLHEAQDEISLLTEGDLFVLRPGVTHRYIGSRMTHIYNCLFSPALLESCEPLALLPGLSELLAPKKRGVQVMHLILSERKACVRQIVAMYEECRERPIGWETRLSAMFTCLLVDYSRFYSAHIQSDHSTGAWSGYVAQALSYIDAHFAEPTLSVCRIAAQVGVSADYLSRQFRRALGIAAQEYIRRYRFARAMELLQQGLPVSQVADQVGFANLCHFSREFKKELGITPSQYRIQNEC